MEDRAWARQVDEPEPPLEPPPELLGVDGAAGAGLAVLVLVLVLLLEDDELLLLFPLEL